MRQKDITMPRHGGATRRPTKNARRRRYTRYFKRWGVAPPRKKQSATTLAEALAREAGDTRARRTSDPVEGWYAVAKNWRAREKPRRQADDEQFMVVGGAA